MDPCERMRSPPLDQDGDQWRELAAALKDLRECASMQEYDSQ
jgi:hypothetical protein